MRGRGQEGRTAIALDSLRKFVLLVRRGGGGCQHRPQMGVEGGQRELEQECGDPWSITSSDGQSWGGGLGSAAAAAVASLSSLRFFEVMVNGNLGDFWWIIDIWAEDIGRARIDQPGGNRHNRRAEGDDVGR